MPRYITIENLEIRGARPPYSFTAPNGTAQNYIANAAVDICGKGRAHHDSQLHSARQRQWSVRGLVCPPVPSRDFLVEANYIYDNGNSGSSQEHNDYSSAIGMVFQYNRFGPLKAGSSGNNLKDRSAGLVVRYNWIQGGNRQLDLVDAADNGPIESDPSYHSTFVYGNILIEPAGDGNQQMVHYGGDSANHRWLPQRHVVLLQQHNGFEANRPHDACSGFRPMTKHATFETTLPMSPRRADTLIMLDMYGRLLLSHNWFKPGLGEHVQPGCWGQVTDDGTSIDRNVPGFHQRGELELQAVLRLGGHQPGDFTQSPGSVGARACLAVCRAPDRRSQAATPPYDLGAFEYSAGPRSRCDYNGDSLTT